MEIRKSNTKTAGSRIKDEKGFVTTAALGLIPILTIALLILGFQQYLTKNWMQSIHTCRVELLKTQKATNQSLQQLLKLNLQARSLRAALQFAYIELGMALASVPPNPGWVASVRLRIEKIKAQQRALDRLQKITIQTANLRLHQGVLTVVQKLKDQDRDNRRRLPKFFKYQIHTLVPRSTHLAVIPDKPDIAPVYELKPDFKSQQTIHVSWINEFQVTEKGPIRWIIQKHQKHQSCQASLDPKQNFQEVLNEDRRSLKFLF